MNNEPKSDRHYMKSIYRRLQWLSYRLANGETNGNTFDQAERVALLWLVDRADLNAKLEELYNEDKPE